MFIVRLSTVLVCAGLMAFSGFAVAEEGLVVHEWGVAIRQPTAQGTVLSSPVELVSDLPSFVIREKNVSKFEPQGWNKPVLWFYGPEQANVTIKVTAPLGFATAHYPPGQLITRRYSHTDRKAMMVSLITEAAGYLWKGTLKNQPSAKLAEVAKDHWWQIAREAGGLYFNANSSSERFLFYEGTALAEPAISATVTERGITVQNEDAEASGQVLVLLKRGEKCFVHRIASIPANGVEKVDQETLFKSAVSAEELLAACAAQWTSFGMTEKEGKAIAAVWREDLLKANQCLLIARMPAKKYEGMFPLSIEPAPAELVRVGMVFDVLDGGAAWLPGREGIAAAVAQATADLASGEWKTRESATQALAGQGVGAKVLLEELAKSENPEVKSRAQILLKKLLPSVKTPVKEGTDERGAVIRAVK